MARIKITRVCAGEYEVSSGGYVVSISRFGHLDYNYGQWVAAALWDRSLYTDPLLYLADAKRIAASMIEEAIADDRRRNQRCSPTAIDQTAEQRS